MLKSHKGTIKILFLLSVILSLSCLSFTRAFGATYEPAKAPKIKSFTASSTNVTAGDTVTLSWDVVNATYIEISGMEKVTDEVLPLTGSLEVNPFSTTTYVLTATSAGGTAKASITVTVPTNSDVTIDYFQVSESQVILGQTVTLSWKTTNAKSISIVGLEKQEEEEEPLPFLGDLEVFPTATTTYLLIAVGDNNKIVTKTLTVTVVEGIPAKINTFSASATQINQGESVTLSWDVTDANYVMMIQDDIKKLPFRGTLVVTPTETTTYVLEALGLDGVIVRKPITVTVLQAQKAPLKLDYKVHDWGWEYIINCDITNQSDNAVSGWTLKLKKSEFDISIIWGATMTETDEFIIISPLGYNSTIKSGITASFGFQAYGSPEPNFYYEFQTK